MLIFSFRRSNFELLVITVVLSAKRRAPSKDEREKLNIEGKTQVVELHRLRSFLGKPVIFEKVIQPLSVFPDIDKVTEFLNALYILYQEKFGITIIAVKDELRAVSASSEYASHLNVSEGDPLLMVERESINIDGRVVECSQAFCSSEHFVYAVEIK